MQPGNWDITRFGPFQSANILLVPEIPSHFNSRVEYKVCIMYIPQNRPQRFASFMGYRSPEAKIIKFFCCGPSTAAACPVCARYYQIYCNPARVLTPPLHWWSIVLSKLWSYIYSKLINNIICLHNLLSPCSYKTCSTGKSGQVRTGWAWDKVWQNNTSYFPVYMCKQAWISS